MRATTYYSLYARIALRYVAVVFRYSEPVPSSSTVRVSKDTAITLRDKVDIAVIVVV